MNTAANSADPAVQGSELRQSRTPSPVPQPKSAEQISEEKLNNQIKAFSDRRRFELQQMRDKANSKPEIKPHEREAIPYLFAAARANTPIEGEEFERYRSAQESLATSRKQLFSGRGNVKKDMERTDLDSTRRTYAGQDLADMLRAGEGDSERAREMAAKFAQKLGVEKIDYRVAWAACARLVGAGNCDENGELGTINHGAKLREGQTVENVDSKRTNHKFAIAKTESTARADDHVIDPWAKGPVVRREHGAFAHQDAVKMVYELDHESGPLMAKQTDDLVKFLKEDPGVQKFIEERLEIYKNKPVEKLVPPGYRWADTAVTSTDFIEDVNDSFDPIMSPSTLRTFATEPDNIPADTREKTKLRAEITAAGVTRNLGENVKESAKAAEDIGSRKTLGKLR